MNVADAVRKSLEAREEALSPFAARSYRSLGRAVPEEPPALRTEFQRDRDRIIHTNAFRRLKHKTQVFIAPLGDHYVTRLTHTLEVAQIARTVARALNLNEDLTEAIALGHDLGHAPFGHVGEEALNQLYPGGFRHAEHSLRIVDVLEKSGQGLNLTWEVRQGIVGHSKPRGALLDVKGPRRLTLEAQVCRLVDAVAYLNHDIRDAVRAGVFREEDVPLGPRRLLGRTPSQRITAMVTDIVESSWAASGRAPLAEGQEPAIAMSPRVRRALTTLREFLFREVYEHLGNAPESFKARRIVELLYRHFCTHPQELPQEYGRLEDSEERRAVDYIAGMTDYFALMTAEGISPGISRGARFMVL